MKKTIYRFKVLQLCYCCYNFVTTFFKKVVTPLNQRWQRVQGVVTTVTSTLYIFILYIYNSIIISYFDTLILNSV